MKKLCDDRRLILASGSPRRRHLLKQAGLSFSVIPGSFDEKTVSISTLSPEVYVKVLAEAKANNVSGRYPENWVIGADTIILINKTILGKPESTDDARRMLKQLSGSTHHVLTGYCICCGAKRRSFSETVTTEVLFKDLPDQHIEWYIHTREPFGKAGSYAIQGIGSFMVKSIKGSYSNVVGLPICEVVDFLIKEGVIDLNFA